MKKFRFTLARMLKFKNQILDKEKDTLGTIRRKKNEIDEKIRASEEQLQRACAEIVQAQQEGIQAGDLRVYNFQVENTRKYLEQLRKGQKAMQAEVERQMEVVKKASQDVSSLEKLRERQWEQYCGEANKAFQAEMLEFVSGRISRSERR